MLQSDSSFPHKVHYDVRQHRANRAKFENVVMSSMHLHSAENKCMEIIVVEGKAADVKGLSKELTTKKGVKQLKLPVKAL